MALVVGDVRRKLLGDGALVVATRVGCAGLWTSFGGVGGWCGWSFRRLQVWRRFVNEVGNVHYGGG